MTIDYFYYFGEVEQHEEIQRDLEVGLLTDQRSQFYYRNFGASLLSYENRNMDLTTEIQLRYEIALFMARRNADVSDGQDGYRDRRAVTSQMAIVVGSLEDTNGVINAVDIEVPYIPYFDMQNKDKVSIKLGT